MLKRRKQMLIRKNQKYIREDDIEIGYDPTAEFKKDSKFISFPKDSEILSNGYSNNENDKNGQRNHNNNHEDSKPPTLTPFENGVDNLPPPPNGAIASDDDCCEINNVNKIKCGLDFCALGCICDSIAKTDHEQYEKHCRDSGDPECIFGCICTEDDPNCCNGKKWTALRDASNKYRQLRWWKDDDDCGFVPPGVKSLAHNEDGRPKRKSQPPERFRHGLNLDKINLNKDYISTRSSQNGNGYFSNGDKRLKRSSAPLTRNGSKSSSSSGSFSSSNSLSLNMNNSNSNRSSVSRSTSRSVSSSSNSSKVSASTNSSSLSRNRNIPVSCSQASFKSITAKMKFASSKPPVLSAQIKINRPPEPPRPQIRMRPNPRKRMLPNGVLQNPCDKHSHNDYGFRSITTGTQIKCEREELNGDTVLINSKGVLIGLVTFTTDDYNKPQVKQVKFRRKFTNNEPPPNLEPNNISASSCYNDSCSSISTECKAMIQESNLLTLLLPDKQTCKEENNIQETSSWRFFELPKNYEDSAFVLYSELHAIFPSNGLQSKIKNAALKQRRASSCTAAAGSSTGMCTSSISDHYLLYPTLIDLNCINLNQQSDPNYKGKTYLLMGFNSASTMIIGTVPPAFLQHSNATIIAQPATHLPFQPYTTTPITPYC